MGARAETGFFKLYRIHSKSRAQEFLTTPLKNCIFQGKKIYIYINGTTFSTFFGMLLLQGTFPRVQILLQLKSPIIVRGTRNTGYFDGHNTQN